MLSRLLGVYLMGLMYSGVVILPAVIVYLGRRNAPALGAIAGAILLPILRSPSWSWPSPVRWAGWWPRSA